MEAVEVRITKEAAEEFAEAYAWYSSHSKDLGREFHTETERVFRLLSEAPEQWLPRKGRYGRVLLRRFPFSVFYRYDGATVQIIAVAHNRRRPGYWKKRV